MRILGMNRIMGARIAFSCSIPAWASAILRIMRNMNQKMLGGMMENKMKFRNCDIVRVSRKSYK